MTLVLDSAGRLLVGSACQDLINEVGLVAQGVSSLLGGLTPPPEISNFVADVTRLRDMVSPSEADGRIEFEFQERELRLLRTALSAQRRTKAEQVQGAQQHVTSPALSRQLDDFLKPLDSVLQHSSLARVMPLHRPSLANFLTVEGRQNKEMIPTLKPEEREQKHRILLSSALLVHDLAVYRRHCEDRRLPLAIVFADLDDFKAFNTELGEVVVDRQILPRVLSAVESSTYGHGRAYRYGGDEFVILFPNTSFAVVESLVLQVKETVERLKFEGTPRTPKLSAGVWITAPSSHLTALELVDRASEAKKAAKLAGKSRVTIRLEVGSEYSERVAGVDA